MYMVYVEVYLVYLVKSKSNSGFIAIIPCKTTSARLLLLQVGTYL